MADKMRFYPAQRDRGSYVPSVTTVCAVLAKPGLVEWKMEQAVNAAARYVNDHGGFPDEYMDSTLRAQFVAEGNDASRSAAEFGTEVHSRIEAYHKSGIERMEGDQLATKLVHSYIDWYTKSVSKPLLVERAVYGTGAGGLPYAGTLDLCAALGPSPIIYQTAKRSKTGVTGSWAIVDIKTSNDFYPEYGMQLAAYAAAETVGHAASAYGISHQNLGTPYLLTVRLDKETHLAYVKEWSFSRYWAMFNAALTLWWELNPSATRNYAKRMAKLIPEPTFDSEVFSNVGEDVEIEVDWDDPVDDVE